MKKTPYEQAGMVDPMLTNAQGMPVDPMQAIQPMQPVNVGMPGSTPIPAGVAQNLHSPVQAGGKMLAPIRQNGKVEKVDAITGSIQKSNEGPIVRTRGAGRVNPHVNFTAFDGSRQKLPSVQQQVDKYDKQVKDEKARERLIQAYKSITNKIN